MEKIKLISFERLSLFWDKVKTYIKGLSWSGTKEEFEEAQAQGLIKEGMYISITNDYEEMEFDIEECTYNEILALFQKPVEGVE